MCTAPSCYSRSEPGWPPAPPLHREASLLLPASRTHTSASCTSCSPFRLTPPSALALHAVRRCHMHHLHTDSLTPFSCSRSKTKSEPLLSSGGNDPFCGSFNIVVHSQELDNAYPCWQKAQNIPVPSKRALSCLSQSHPHLPSILTLALLTFPQPGCTSPFP